MTCSLQLGIGGTHVSEVGPTCGQECALILPSSHISHENFSLKLKRTINTVAAFRGMHISPATHSYA